MEIVACPKCGSRFDVSSFEPGSTFLCGSCRNALKVPGKSGPAAPAGPSRATPGRAGSGLRAGAGKKVDPRRAGAGGAAVPTGPKIVKRAGPAPVPRKPAGPKTDGGEGDEPPPKSKLPLILGGAGGLVVILVVVGIFVFGGSRNDGSGGGGPVSTGDAREDLRLRLDNEGVAARSVSECRRVFDAATAEGFDKIAEYVANKALDSDPTLDWANQAVGNADLTSIWSQVPMDDDLLMSYPTPEYERLVERMESGGKRWATPEEYERIKGWLASTLEHAKKLEDPKYLDAYVVKMFVRKHPIFGKRLHVVREVYPYVVFVEYPVGGDTAENAEKATAIAERDAAALGSLYEKFLDLFGSHFSLVPLDERKAPDERALKVWTFFDRSRFEDYLVKAGQKVRVGERGFYNPADQWITIYEGEGEEAEAPAGSSSFNVEKLLHEGVHQLVHSFKKSQLEKERETSVFWTDPAMRPRSFWFQEGFAEFLATTRPGADGGLEFMAVNTPRLAEWKGSQKARLKEWHINELFGVANRIQMTQQAGRKDKTPEGIARLSSLFYAQAWAFCHFLWFHEDGKYRDKLLAYLDSELRGRSGYRYWADLWKRDRSWQNADWADLDKEWRTYARELWADIEPR